MEYLRWRSAMHGFMNRTENVILNKFIKVNTNDCIGFCVNNDIETNTKYTVDSVVAVHGSETSLMSMDDISKSVKLDLSMPCDVLRKMGIKFLYVSMKDKDTHDTAASSYKSAFHVLMQMATKYEYLPHKRKENSSKDCLFNDLVDFLSNMKVGLLSSQETLAKFCDILWYLDPFHQKFADRGYRVPEKLEFTGYMVWKKQDKQQPRISSEELKLQAEAPGSLIMLPWIFNRKYLSLRNILEDLLNTVQKYLSFLQKQNDRTKEKDASK